VKYDGSLGIGEFSYDVKTAPAYEVKGAGNTAYSAKLDKLAPDDMESWVLSELDRVALAHNTFTPEALGLIVRSGEGVLRRTRNLCIATLLEAVRDRKRSVDLKQVNRVLLQPHWRREQYLPEALP